MVISPVPPFDRAQINRIDTNIQDLQSRLKEHLELMTANLLDRPYPTPVIPTEAATINHDGLPIIAPSANLDTPGAENAVNRGENEGASDVKIFVWMDSNGNGIDPVKF